MKICPECGQTVAEEVTTCPSCGGKVGSARSHIDGFRILQTLHEGHASTLYHAIREESGEHVMIRLFTPGSGVDEQVAGRLQQELEKLKELPGERFVRHRAIRRSSEGLWYRVSEWIDAENWGSLLASGRLRYMDSKLDLFQQVAATLGTLHEHGHIIPHLILNDIMVVEEEQGRFRAQIDYKLSRFLDPKMDRPGPMLQQLLGRHPDITNRRPLDARSDVWSLGKAFVEILAGDLDIPDHEAAVDRLDAPEELKVLLRVMLADDPDLRPQSMENIAELLSQIRRSARAETTPSHAGSIRRLHKRFTWLAIAVVFLALASLATWYLGWQRQDVEEALEEYANRYVQSVAFVLADYGLEVDGEKIYGNASEGTAFLVDDEGRLLTSRHVVCPWLEDYQLLHRAGELLDNGKSPRLRYNIYLWFEGAKAFNRAGHLIESHNIADYFFLEHAYSTLQPVDLVIAGVTPPPVRTRQLLASPLKDDVAVIELENPPEGLEPLPLDTSADPHVIPRLSHLIAIGFPLGSRTQEDTVNASAVDGHARRSFENMLQIASSLHGGNSGGPVIDADGNVIGIVSAVAADSAGPFGGTRPLVDIGLILPITGAVELLSQIKAGETKWNGVLDFSLASTIEEIKEKALEGRWTEARALAENKLEGNLQAELLTARGMMAFATGESAVAEQSFSRVLSIHPDDGLAKLMLYLIDFLAGSALTSPHRQELMGADWRSPIEFAGYLVRLLETPAPDEALIEAWQNPSERSWANFIAGLHYSKSGDARKAETLLREAALAADADSWAFYLALARLDRLYDDGRAAERRQLLREAKESLAAAQARERLIAPLRAELAAGEMEFEDRLPLLEKIAELEPADFDSVAMLAFHHAAAENWPAALEQTRGFLAKEGRPTAARLSLRLLEAGIIRYQGSMDEAGQILEEYADLLHDDWFLAINDYLRGRTDDESIKSEAGRSPEHLLTAYTMMGFWAEAGGDRQLAVSLYREALGSFLDDWLVYGFARERIRRLREPDEKSE
jgi:S1-C subfamily serine protease